jgi:hypothetical protein
MTDQVIAAIAGIAAVVASIATVGLKLATCAYVMRWGESEGVVEFEVRDTDRR